MSTIKDSSSLPESLLPSGRAMKLQSLGRIGSECPFVQPSHCSNQRLLETVSRISQVGHSTSPPLLSELAQVEQSEVAGEPASDGFAVASDERGGGVHACTKEVSAT